MYVLIERLKEDARCRERERERERDILSRRENRWELRERYGISFSVETPNHNLESKLKSYSSSAYFHKRKENKHICITTLQVMIFILLD